MVNVSPDDAELEHLLTQLLRMVSPAFSADDAGAETQPGAGPVNGQITPDPGAAPDAPPRLAAMQGSRRGLLSRRRRRAR